MDGMGSVSHGRDAAQRADDAATRERNQREAGAGASSGARPGLDEIGQLVPELASTAENTCQASRAFAVKLRMM